MLGRESGPFFIRTLMTPGGEVLVLIHNGKRGKVYASHDYVPHAMLLDSPADLVARNDSANAEFVAVDGVVLSPIEAAWLRDVMSEACAWFDIELDENGAKPVVPAPTNYMEARRRKRGGTSS
jgi:hypothetical protein